MKKLFIVIAILALGLNSYSRENELKNYPNGFRVGLGQLMVGRLNLSYERLYNKSSFILTGEVQSQNTHNKQISGGMGEIQFRNYLAPVGKPFSDEIYIGIFASYRYTNIRTSVDETEMKRPGAGVILGVKYILAENLVLDVYFGGIYTYALEEAAIGLNDFDYQMFSLGYYGVRPVMNVTLGIEF